MCSKIWAGQRRPVPLHPPALLSKAVYVGISAIQHNRCTRFPSLCGRGGLVAPSRALIHIDLCLMLSQRMERSTAGRRTAQRGIAWHQPARLCWPVFVYLSARERAHWGLRKHVSYTCTHLFNVIVKLWLKAFSCSKDSLLTIITEFLLLRPQGRVKAQVANVCNYLLLERYLVALTQQRSKFASSILPCIVCPLPPLQSRSR